MPGGKPSAIRGSGGAVVHDRLFEDPLRSRPARLPSVEGGPLRAEGKVHLREWVSAQSDHRRFGARPAEGMRRFRAFPAPAATARPLARQPGLWAMFGLGALWLLLGKIEAHFLQGPGLLLGANLLVGPPPLNPTGEASSGAGPASRSGQSPALPTLGERFRIWLSPGLEKIRLLRGLAERLEGAGYLREARERYEQAVDLAEKEMDRLAPRNPETRPLAGEVHRALGKAYLALAAYWDRREEGRSAAVENYQMAFKYLRPLGFLSERDGMLLATVQERLKRLHMEEAELWASRGQWARAGEHFEATADVSALPKAEGPRGARSDPDASRLAWLWRAARAYVRADSPRYEDFARVMDKIHREEE